MRTTALYCFSCLIVSLSVRTSGAAESTPLPLPSSKTAIFSMDTGLWRVFLALLILFAVILIIRWSVRRSTKNVGVRGEKGKSIEILERKVLGPKQSLLLVRVCGKKVLLHQGKGSFTPLCEIEESEEAPSND